MHGDYIDTPTARVCNNRIATAGPWTPAYIGVCIQGRLKKKFLILFEGCLIAALPTLGVYNMKVRKIAIREYNSMSML